MKPMNHLSTVFLAVCISLALALTAPVICPIEEFRQRSNEQFFTVLHTNDEHSSLVPTLSLGQPETASGGFAQLAAVVSAIRAEKESVNEPVLLFSGGDFLGETAYGWLSTQGYAPELRLMQEIGYDAVTIGNHEYDFGPDVLADYLQAAGYPDAHNRTLVLASNTQVPENHPLRQNNLIRSSGLITLDNGLSIGLFAVIGENAISVTSDTGNITFANQHQVAQAQVEMLREQGADVVIMLSHSGEDEDIACAKAVSGIDVIIGGHSHTLLSEPIQEGQTLIVQAGSQTRYLGRIELAYNSVDGTVRMRNEENNRPAVIAIDDQVTPDPLIQSLIESDTQTLNQLLTDMSGQQFTDVHAPLLRSESMLTHRPAFRETPAGNFITDGMRLITESVTGQPVDLAVMANGNIRGSIIPNPADGTISFYDLTNMVGLGYGSDGYPGYSIASVYLTGEELRRVFEVAALLPELMGDDYFLQFSGIQYEYNPQDTVLFTVPFIDQPLPSLHAVKKAFLYRGENIQTSDPADYTPIKRGDDTLYHLVTDTYILSFLPMAGEILPQLEIVPKNKNGESIPVERFKELTVPYEGRQLKVWETVALYAKTLSGDTSEPADIPQVYQTTPVRIKTKTSIPLVYWLFVVLILFLVLVVLVIRTAVRKRRQKANRTIIQ